MALSRASRSVSLSSPAATGSTRPGVRAVGGGELGDTLTGAADPLGLAGGVVAPVEGYRDAPELRWPADEQPELPHLPVVGMEPLVGAPIPVFWAAFGGSWR